MNPYTRAVLFVIRLIGFGFIAVSLGLLAQDLGLAVSKDKSVRVGMLVLEGILFLIGSFVLWKSSEIARRLTEDL